MKNTLLLILLLVVIDLSFQRCANPGRPTGGPKDTIPPVLLKTFPLNGSTNYTATEITLEFDEYINADKLRQNLIVTPNFDIAYKLLVKKNILIIKFLSELEDSTTYSFNFFNGVTDITERNPVENLTLAFSTGPYIDSLNISGTVKELMTMQKQPDMLVGLYRYSDTLDYFKHKPNYFTTTSDSGNFSISYIKNDIYQLLSFNDENNNLILDPETEAHAFLAENIVIKDTTVVGEIYSVLQNVQPIELISSRSIGKYFEATYNKHIDHYYDSTRVLSSNVVGKNRNIIRFYKNDKIKFQDTIHHKIFAYDSLGNVAKDTIGVMFLESNRKREDFTVSIKKSNKELKENNTLTITANKPISKIYRDSISLWLDTLYLDEILIDTILFKENRTISELSFTIREDSVINILASLAPRDSLSLIPNDSLKTDKKLLNENNNLIDPKLTISLPYGTIVSIENDTAEVIQASGLYFPKKGDKENYGVLKLRIETKQPSYFLQLLDKNKKVKYKSYSESSVSFSQVIPGDYSLRILIDNNNDGKWSFGNLLKRQEPEQVIIFPQTYSIRANFIVEEEIVF